MITATELIDPDKLYYHYTGSYCLELPIPGQCVIDCAHQGECYDDCDYWIDSLNWDLDMRKVHLELLEYGAWDQDELIAKGEREVKIILLWIACNDISEAVYMGDYRD